MPILSNRSGNADFHSTGYQVQASTSEGPGSRLIGGAAVTLTSSVVYDFESGSLPAFISNPAMSYGGFGQTGGRGFVAVSTTYAGLYSPNVYTFDDLFFDSFPAVGNGATTEAYSSFWLDTVTQPAGTSIGFFYDGINDQLYCSNWVGYSDASGGEVVLSNARTAHPKWRLTRSGGNILWRTSVDGITWTTQRTIAIPAWVTGSNLAFWWDAHRAEGTANQFQFDNLNVPVAAGAILDLSGSSSVTSVATGQFAGLSGIDGQSAVSPVAAAELTLSGDVSGQSVSTPLATGQFGTLATLSGQALATPLASGQLVLSRTLSGASSVTPVAAGTVATRMVLAGAGLTSASSTGQFIRLVQIDPSASMATPVSSGSLALISGPVTLSLSGASVVTPVATGSLAAPGQTAGSSVVTPVASGSLVATGVLSGTVAITPVSGGALAGRGQVSGQSLATPLATGQLANRGALSGQVLATPLSTGQVDVGTAPLVLSGASVTTPVSAGQVVRRAALAGAGAVAPAVTGGLALRVVITGTVVTYPASIGSFGMRMTLAGLTARSAVSSGTLLLIGLVPEITFPIDDGLTAPLDGWTPEISQHLTPPIAGSITSPM